MTTPTATSTAAPAAASQGPHRRHDIDALRALAFLFVILYHVGMYYVADWHFHLKSPHAATWLQAPMVILNLWRMDLVFLISGVSLGFLSRGQGTWALLRSRSVRLLLPLPSAWRWSCRTRPMRRAWPTGWSRRASAPSCCATCR